MNLDDFDCNDRERKVPFIWTLILILGIDIGLIVLLAWAISGLVAAWKAMR